MKKKNGILILVIIGILVIWAGIGFAAKKAYDRHQEELRLQAIGTKNSEIDATSPKTIYLFVRLFGFCKKRGEGILS